MWIFAATLITVLTAQENTIDRAGRAAESFWGQFTAVQSKERVTQTKVKADGKILASQLEEFDYVSFLKASNRGLMVEESRVSRSKAVKGAAPFLITSGFPALLLMFHPDFRDRFEFTEVPGIADPSTRRFAFKSKPETASMSALKLQDHLYPILWKGAATLDASSGAIRRIEADLAGSMEDLGLSELHVEVDYGPAVLAGSREVFWLPARATISLKTPRQAWRNVHEFSDYKKFSVTTSTREGRPE